MPNVGDELHHFGWNLLFARPAAGSSASTWSSPASAPRASTSWTSPTTPAAPQIVKVIEPEEIVKKTGYTRPHTVHCMPGDNITSACSATRKGTGRRVRGAGREDFRCWAAGRTEADQQFNYDFWYQPRKNAMVSQRVGRAQHLRGRVQPGGRGAGSYGHRLHFWDLESGGHNQTVDLGESGLIPLECAGSTTPTRRPASSARRSRARCGAFTAKRRLGGGAGDRGGAARAGGLAVPGAGADHRPAAVDGRPLPLLLELAARGPAAVRRLGPGSPEVDRAALARRRARRRATRAAS